MPTRGMIFYCPNRFGGSSIAVIRIQVRQVQQPLRKNRKFLRSRNAEVPQVRRQSRTPDFRGGNSVQRFRLVCNGLQRQEFRSYLGCEIRRQQLIHLERLFFFDFGRFQIRGFRRYQQFEIFGFKIGRFQAGRREIIPREGNRKEEEIVAYSFKSFRYARNFAPKFGFRSAYSTVAFKNPSLSPASCVIPS